MKTRSVMFASAVAMLLAVAPFGAFAATAQEKAACFHRHGQLMGKQVPANIEACYRAHGQLMTK